MFGKWFDSAYTGSLAGSGADVFAVWTYALAHTWNSGVELNPLVVAGLIGMPVENVERAIEFLCRPDPKSRNPEQEGRRLVYESGFKYQVVSQPIYRGMRSYGDRNEYLRIKQRESRARRKTAKSSDVSTLSTLSTPVNTSQPCRPITEVETETEVREPNGSLLGRVPPKELAGTLPLIDGSDYEISKTQMRDWAEAFPAVNVKQQLLEFKEWLKANPTKRKTRRGILRSVVHWLSHEQDKPAFARTPFGAPPPPTVKIRTGPVGG